MRLFIGIPLGAALIEELWGISTSLRSDGDGLRWSSPESWHITLQFLGDTNSERYRCILARLSEVHLPGIPI
jgi:RNA 2',3'-cyclic 3'-phosphodiesterase